MKDDCGIKFYIKTRTIGRLKCMCAGEHVLLNSDILKPTKEHNHKGKCLRCDYDLLFKVCPNDDTVVLVDEI